MTDLASHGLAGSALHRQLAFELLSGEELSSVDAETAIAMLAGCEALVSWLTARQNDLLVAAAGSIPQDLRYLVRDDGKSRSNDIHAVTDVMREEIALALRWSFAHTQQRIDAARMLSRSLPLTRAALSDGEISPSHATAIAKGAATVPEDRRHEYEARVLPTALGQTITRTRQQAARVADSLGEEGRVERRRAACRREAGVWVYPEPDGLATLVARMPMEDAVVVSNAIDQFVNGASNDDDDLIGVRRAAALRALVMGGSAEASGGGRTGARVSVDVVIDLDSLLGFADTAAEIGGMSGISAEAVRQLIADDPDATLRKLVTDSTTGQLVAVGQHRYQVTGRLREFLELRDRRCRFPGCRRKAAMCEIDHATPWDKGGRSSPENLGALCKRHHQLKTHAGWRIVDSHVSGACVWISPTGQEFRHGAVPVLQSTA